MDWLVGIYGHDYAQENFRKWLRDASKRHYKNLKFYPDLAELRFYTIRFHDDDEPLMADLLRAKLYDASRFKNQIGLRSLWAKIGLGIFLFSLRLWGWNAIELKKFRPIKNHYHKMEGLCIKEPSHDWNPQRDNKKILMDWDIRPPDWYMSIFLLGGKKDKKGD